MLIRVRSIALLLAVAFALSYCGYAIYMNRVAEASENERTRLERDVAAQSLRAFALKHRADAEWPGKLAGKDGRRLSPVMSAELQDLWMTGAPMLLVGNVRDIARDSDGSFRVLVEYSEFGLRHSFSTKIGMNLKCSPEITGPLLDASKRKIYTSIFPDTAVVAKVDSVTAERVPATDGDSQVRLLGQGDCVAAMSVSRSLPRDWMKPSGTQ
jgi:hypothetical protein